MNNAIKIHGQNKKENFEKETKKSLKLFNTSIHQHSSLTDDNEKKELIKSKFQYLTPKLTVREEECLFYTLHGKTAKAISQVLGVSPKTIEFHLANLKQKFNCYSKSELISKAIEEGFF